MEAMGLSWVALQSIIRELAILAGAAALVFAAAQVRQMQRMREAETLLKILEMDLEVLGTNPIATFRRNFQMGQAFMNYEEFVQREAMPEAAQAGKLILMYMFMGIVLRQKLLSEESLMRWHAPAITRGWRTLSPIVEGLRRETNNHGFGRHFEYLAVRAASWLRRHQAAERKFLARVNQESKRLREEERPLDVTVYVDLSKGSQSGNKS